MATAEEVRLLDLIDTMEYADRAQPGGVFDTEMVRELLTLAKKQAEQLRCLRRDAEDSDKDYVSDEVRLLLKKMRRKIKNCVEDTVDDVLGVISDSGKKVE